MVEHRNIIVQGKKYHFNVLKRIKGKADISRVKIYDDKSYMRKAKVITTENYMNFIKYNMKHLLKRGLRFCSNDI